MLDTASAPQEPVAYALFLVAQPNTHSPRVPLTQPLLALDNRN